MIPIILYLEEDCTNARYQVSGMPDKNKLPAKALNNSVSNTPIKPSAKQVKISDEDETDFKKIYDLMVQMNSKLDKLDQIEIHLAKVDQDIKDLKHSYTFVNKTTDELKKKQADQDSVGSPVNTRHVG